MGRFTEISWCDSTFNMWIGCSRVSPGCKNCYAEVLMDQRMKRVKWGPGNPRSRTSTGNWKKPLRWEREHQAFFAKHGRRQRVFCASLADWLDPEVPIEWLADLLALIKATPHLDWLLLTKRPQLWSDRLHEVVRDCHDGADMIASSWLDGDAPKNVWVGTTVEDQQRAAERIPQLLGIPAAVRFLSCEPLLGHVELFGLLDNIHWVIAGGESGSNARPMHPDWARSLRDQCEAAGVPFLFKQHGAWSPVYDRDRDDPDWRQIPNETPDCKRINLAGGQGFHGERVVYFDRVGKKKAGRLLDGVEHTEFPEAVTA